MRVGERSVLASATDVELISTFCFVQRLWNLRPLALWFASLGDPVRDRNWIRLSVVASFSFEHLSLGLALTRLRMNSMSERPQRIVVVGTSGAGKSTLARKLATALRVPHVELDTLFWEPRWIEASTDIFRERVERATESPSWVADGNYGKVRDFTWGKANTLIWLDYSLRTIMGRALFRAVRRSVTREVLWNGNTESLRQAFFSRKSILIWVLQTYERRKREYPALLSLPEYSHLKVLRFKTPKEADRYLGRLAK